MAEFDVSANNQRHDHLYPSLDVTPRRMPVRKNYSKVQPSARLTKS